MRRNLRWLNGELLLVLACCLASCKGGLRAQPNPGARLWVEGPVRWLIQPDEQKEFKGLHETRETLDFIEAFWRRRDPTPVDIENPFRTRFFERSVAADRLYSEGSRRGSLTDRGRVLILFGPPSILRYRQQAVPILEPSQARGGGAGRTRRMTQEVWIYLPADLAPELLEQLDPAERTAGIEFVFSSDLKRTYLVDGERHCELAARLALRTAPE